MTLHTQPLEDDDALAPVYAELATRFLASFPATPQTPARTVGRELEFPIVDADGNAADVRRLWQMLLADGSLEPKYDTGTPNLIVAATGDDYSYSIEVGVGTIEMNTRPCQTLLEIEQIVQQGVARLVHAAARLGWRVLGYGIQPITPPSLRLMTPKQRYQSLYRAMGSEWLWYTVTAADQCHVSLTRAEAIPLLNFGNIMAPVLVSLCANSPVFGGRVSPYASAREGQHMLIHANENRHGIPARPYADAADFVRRVSQSIELIHRADNLVIPNAQPFTAYLAEHGARTDADYDAFLFHEHYLWNSARIRAAYGTIEVRPCCQQPWSETMAAAALTLGIIDAHQEIQAYLEQTLGVEEYWETLRAWYPQVVRQGLAAPQPAPDFLRAIVSMAETSLRQRGFGEETLLEPVWRRLERHENPAQRARRIFLTDGMHALIAHVAIHPAQLNQ